MLGSLRGLHVAGKGHTAETSRFRAERQVFSFVDPKQTFPLRLTDERQTS